MTHLLTSFGAVAFLMLGTATGIAQTTVQGKIPLELLRECQKNPGFMPYCAQLIKANPQPAKQTIQPVLQVPVVKNPPAPNPPPQVVSLLPTGTGPCGFGAVNKLFVRAADQMDNFNYDSYLVNLLSSTPTTSMAADAKGASISYTDNVANGTQTATIDARASYLMFGGFCNDPFTDRNIPFVDGYAVAPFVLGNGNWNEPLTKTSTSAARVGTDLQLAVTSAMLPISRSYFYISPFYQTDFRGIAQIGGADFAWEPFAPEIALGTSAKGDPNAYYTFIWQFKAEAELTDVSNPGLTNLIKGNHTWIGETTSATLGILPLNAQNEKSWGDIAGRISVNASAEYYYDTQTGANAPYYTASINYKLGPCKQTSGQQSREIAAATAACTIQGSSAISFEYDWGTNKDTLVKTNQYLVKFNYAY